MLKASAFISKSKLFSSDPQTHEDCSMIKGMELFAVLPRAILGDDCGILERGVSYYDMRNVMVKFCKHNEGELWTPDSGMGFAPVEIVGLPTAHHIGLLRPNTFVNTILTSLCTLIL